MSALRMRYKAQKPATPLPHPTSKQATRASMRRAQKQPPLSLESFSAAARVASQMVPLLEPYRPTDSPASAPLRAPLRIRRNPWQGAHQGPAAPRDRAHPKRELRSAHEISLELNQHCSRCSLQPFPQPQNAAAYPALNRTQRFVQTGRNFRMAQALEI